MRRSPALFVVVVVLGLPSAVLAAPAPATTYGPGSFVNPSTSYYCHPGPRLGSATTTQTGEIRASLKSHPVYITEDECYASGSVEVTYTVGPRVKEIPVEVTVHYGQRPDSTRFTSEDMRDGDHVWLLLNTWVGGHAPNGGTYIDSRYPQTPDYSSRWGFCPMIEPCRPPMPQEIVIEGTDVRTQSVIRPSDHAEPGASYLPEGTWRIRVGTGMGFDLHHSLGSHASHTSVKLGGELRADIKQVRVGG